MGTVFRFNNIRFQVYSKDHNPPHCHVIGPGAHAKFEINTGKCISNKGFDAVTLKKLSKRVLEGQQELMEEWERCHGKED